VFLTQLILIGYPRAETSQHNRISWLSTTEEKAEPNIPSVIGSYTAHTVQFHGPISVSDVRGQKKNIKDRKKTFS